MAVGLTAPPTLRNLRTILAALPEASAWQQEARQQSRLQACLNRLLPSALSASCQIRLEDDGTAVLSCPSSVVAGRLRQIGPRLMHQLGALDGKVMAIRVEVQPLRAAAKQTAHVKVQRNIPAGVADNLAVLAASTRPGELADAIARLAERLRTAELAGRGGAADPAAVAGPAEGSRS